MSSIFIAFAPSIAALHRLLLEQRCKREAQVQTVNAGSLGHGLCNHTLTELCSWLSYPTVEQSSKLCPRCLPAHCLNRFQFRPVSPTQMR